jgi:hypothetical protein
MRNNVEFDMAAAKFNMAAAKPEAVSTLDADTILMLFQMHWRGFGTNQPNRSAANDVSVARNVHFQRVCRQTRSSLNCDPGCGLDAVPKAIMCFSDPQTQQKCYY